MVWYLRWVGIDREEAVRLFKYTKNYKEHVTRYHVNYAYDHGYLTPRCERLREKGLCLGCGWNKNPTTYTYVRAAVPEELKEEFFRRATGG